MSLKKQKKKELGPQVWIYISIRYFLNHTVSKASYPPLTFG